MEKTMKSKLNVKINTMKTKTLVCSRENNIKTRIKLKGDKIIDKQMTSNIQEELYAQIGDAKKGIVKRICQAKVAFNKKVSLLTSDI